MTTLENVARSNEIIRVLIGSTAHGTGLPGAEDRDEMGVFIEPPDMILGLDRHYEHWLYRTQPEGVRSQPDDLDLMIYGLKKYLRMAAEGSPSILLLLYAPVLNITELGTGLRELAPLLASRKAGERFAGYLQAQLERLLGLRGGRHGSPRQELVDKFGFDTKFAMHAVRLGYQGVEYLTTGKISCPMQGDEAERCRTIRRGEVSCDDVVKQAIALHEEILYLQEHGPLPVEPDLKGVTDWMIHAYLTHWGVR